MIEKESITILCPKLLSSGNESDLQWLVGSQFFRRPTIISTFRCIHTNSGLSVDFLKESEEIRTLLPRGFEVIGALVVGASDWENNASKAIDAARKLRVLLYEGEGTGLEETVGAVADSNGVDIRFFVSNSGNSTSLEHVTSVLYEENPDKYVWENGCLLRCKLSLKVPVYFPDNNLTDAEKNFLLKTEDVLAKLKDPNVAYIVDVSNKASENAEMPIILRATDLNSDIDLQNLQIKGENSQISGQSLMQCEKFCLKSKSSELSAENADIIQVSILFNRSEKSRKPSAPVAQYFPAMEDAKLVLVDFSLEVMCYATKSIPICYAVSKLVIPALGDQLNAMKKTTLPHLLSQHPQVCARHRPVLGFTLQLIPKMLIYKLQQAVLPTHIATSISLLSTWLLIPITVIYELNYGETEMKQVKVRKSLHSRLGLPLDRPLLRIANAIYLSTVATSKKNLIQKGSTFLKDVHMGIPSSGVSGGFSSLVQGSYEYYHYLQNGYDDVGWGCAYRSLQTIISWFRLQHYTFVDVPSHRDIQQALVDIGDKDPSFVGSQEWIGAIELSFVLDKLLGVSCKVLNIRSGAEFPEKCRELALHFANQGTPVMIGGGVLAYTLLGVDYNETSGDCAFLILDPHYTGVDDLKKVVNGGWCGWKKALDSKGKNFFLHDKFYNLLLPQRPNMV